MSKLTVNALKAECIRQLNTKPLKEITVKSLTDAVGLNRNTFYYHYADIPQLIEGIMTDFVDEVIAQTKSIDSLEEGFKIIVKFVENNKIAAKNLFNSGNRNIFEKELLKICDYVTRAYASTIFPKDKIPVEKVELVIEFYRCEIFGEILEWMHLGMQNDLLNRFTMLYNFSKDLIINLAMEYDIEL